MFTEKDILARLQNGESVEAIANEVAELLNKANSTYEAEVEAQKAKEAEATKTKEKEKIDDLQDIIDLIAVWVNKHYGVDTEVFDLITPQEVISIIDECKAYLKGLDSLMKTLGTDELFTGKKFRKRPTTTTIVDADQKLADFIANMGW